MERLTRESLEQLKRRELQQLAKEFKVKANMKSVAIIEELFQIGQTLLNEKQLSEASDESEEEAPAQEAESEEEDFEVDEPILEESVVEPSTRLSVVNEVEEVENPISEDDEPEEEFLKSAQIEPAEVEDTPSKRMGGPLLGLTPKNDQVLFDTPSKTDERTYEKFNVHFTMQEYTEEVAQSPKAEEGVEEIVVKASSTMALSRRRELAKSRSKSVAKLRHEKTFKNARFDPIIRAHTRPTKLTPKRTMIHKKRKATPCPQKAVWVAPPQFVVKKSEKAPTVPQPFKLTKVIEEDVTNGLTVGQSENVDAQNAKEMPPPKREYKNSAHARKSQQQRRKRFLDNGKKMSNMQRNKNRPGLA